MKFRAICFPIILGLVSLTAQFGCNSAPTDGQSSSTFDYVIRATVVQDPNIDSSRIIAKLLRENKDYPSATLTFGSDNLAFSNLKYGFDSIYTFSKTNTPGYAEGASSLALSDAPFFSGNVNVTVPGPFSIIVVNNPSNHIVRPGETVSYTWEGSANAVGYVIATVLSDSAYRSYGYSEYLPVIGTSGALPVEAFSQSPSPDIDTGLYNIYVYAITGVPDSALTDRLLPVPLPLQFPNNINSADLVGRVGAIQVTLLDTVRAQTSR